MLWSAAVWRKSKSLAKTVLPLAENRIQLYSRPFNVDINWALMFCGWLIGSALHSSKCWLNWGLGFRSVHSPNRSGVIQAISALATKSGPRLSDLQDWDALRSIFWRMASRSPRLFILSWTQGLLGRIGPLRYRIISIACQGDLCYAVNGWREILTPVEMSLANLSPGIGFEKGRNGAMTSSFSSPKARNQLQSIAGTDLLPGWCNEEINIPLLACRRSCKTNRPFQSPLYWSSAVMHLAIRTMTSFEAYLKETDMWRQRKLNTFWALPRQSYGRLIDPGTRNQVLSLEMRIHQLDADQYGAGIELSKRFLTILHAAEESNRNSIATRNES